MTEAFGKHPSCHFMACIDGNIYTPSRGWVPCPVCEAKRTHAQRPPVTIRAELNKRLSDYHSSNGNGGAAAKAKEGKL